MKKGTEKQLHQWDQLRRNGKSEDASWQNIWEAADDFGSDFTPDVEAGLNKLKHRIAQDQTASAKVVQLSPKRWLRNVAAAAVLVLGIAAAFHYANGTEATGPAAWVEVQTQANEQRELILPDGSTINLNENSVLAYRSDLNEASTRQVQLTGEAFFDVDRRPEQPFLITTERAEVRVLGTSFNVRALREESNTEVEVSTGRVAVRALEVDHEIILEANEAAVLRSDNQLIEEAAPFLNRTAWHSGQLTFRETPVKEALELMERFYGIDFELGNSHLNSCTLSGNWNQVALSDALVSLEELTSLKVSATSANSYRVAGTCK